VREVLGSGSAGMVRWALSNVLLGSLGSEGKESDVDKQATWETLKQQAVERSDERREGDRVC
jgi:hypothetical protein